jgi:hypothetical protein
MYSFELTAGFPLIGFDEIEVFAQRSAEMELTVEVEVDDDETRHHAEQFLHGDVGHARAVRRRERMREFSIHQQVTQK